MKYTPDMNNGTNIFVFGSNLAGIHGAGAALDARLHWGAEIGRGAGRTGNAYAIPTKDFNIETLTLSDIKAFVDHFEVYAKSHPEKTFLVTAIGCGLAGYSPKDIKPFFSYCPSNVILPPEFQ